MNQLSPEFYWLMLVIVLWTLPWKGVALWRAAKRGQKVWFIVLFLVNTAAILEIIYIFYFSRKPINISVNTLENKNQNI